MNTLQQFFRMLPALLISMVTIGCTQTKQNPPRTGLQQIGLVWLKQPGNADARRKVIDAVHDFGRLIPEVTSATAGTTDGIGGPYSDTSYDVCFILTFADEAARQRYNEHPVHQKAAREVFLPLSRKLLFYRFAGQ